MTDKEMIEEMAKIIDDRLLEANGWLGSMNKGEGHWIAQKLIEHYQPKLSKDSVVLPKSEYNDLVESKRQLGCYIEDQAILLQGNIPQGCVVLSREEYDCLKKIEKAYDPFWFCSFGGCEGVCKGCKDTCEMSIFVKERKETAEKIMLDLKPLLEGFIHKETGENLYVYKCKQFGVDVKE